MTEYMTIQTFSERVGIAKSAIRYYESEGLLGSVRRNASGYRVYEEGQIEMVRLITSLRMADIAVTDIKRYVKEASEPERQQLMNQWIRAIKMRQEVLAASLRYLESDSLGEKVYLIEKDREMVIWYQATSGIGKFREHFVKRIMELGKLKIPIQNSYLKYVSGFDLIEASIGFGVPLGMELRGLTGDFQLEIVAPAMYIAIPFTGSFEDIKAGYEKLLGYSENHGWQPFGPLLEWYRGADLTIVDLLLPVTHVAERGGQ